MGEKEAEEWQAGAPDLPAPALHRRAGFEGSSGDLRSGWQPNPLQGRGNLGACRTPRSPETCILRSVAEGTTVSWPG